MTSVLENLKEKDYDKYLACLLAGKDSQLTLAALFLFHHEIYDIPQSVSEPMVGKIKIQWWRDVLKEIEDGKPARPHPILQEIKNSPETFPFLQEILDSYETVLDGYQPKNFKEVKEFLEKSICNIFKATNTVTKHEYDADLALAYSYQFIARKIATNSSFAKNLELIPEKLAQDAKVLLPKRNSAFKIIAEHYIKLLEKYDFKPSIKNIKNSQWKLAVKLFFKSPSIF